MSKQILVIEDNEDLSNLLQIHLKDQNWHVDTAQDGETGYALSVRNAYNLIILDVMLPKMGSRFRHDGFDILKEIRRQGISTPVLILTSKSSEIDRVLGLELGADDYVTKPFSIRELIARIKAIFRRTEGAGRKEASPDDHMVFKCRELIIHPEKRKVTLAQEDIDLTAKEYDLLFFLIRHPGRVFTRSQLLDQVWGYGHDGYEHTVNSNINRLRAKIEAEPRNPEYILTVWGVGYKFADEVTRHHA